MQASHAAAPVPAARRPVVRSYFGVEVTDDYVWLEDTAPPEVRAFDEAQQAVARGLLDPLPLRSRLRARLETLLAAPAPEVTSVQVASGKVFALRGGSLVVSTTLKDERAITDGSVQIDAFAASPDGAAVAVSFAGADIHVLDAATGRERGDVVHRDHATEPPSLAWNIDGSAFFYTTGAAVMVHRRSGVDSQSLVTNGVTQLLRSDDGRRLLARVGGPDAAEVQLLEAGTWSRLARAEDGVVRASFGADGRVVAVSREGAPRGKVVVLERTGTSVLVPEGDGTIEDVVVTRSAIYVVEDAGGGSRMRRFARDPKVEPLAREPRPPRKGEKTPPPPTVVAPGERGLAAALLPLPPHANVTGAVRLGEDVLVRSEGALSPSRWDVYRGGEHRLLPTALVQKASYDTADLEVARASCPLPDGSRIAMRVLRHRDTKLDDARPTLITGFGSGHSRMRASDRVWIDEGGVVAEARVPRGRSAEALVACARTLGDLHHTTPARLAVRGAPAGAVGIALVREPGLFGAVVVGPGPYDFLRPGMNAQSFRELFAASPYHHVVDGVAYPAVLVLGGGDPSVDHARKMVARLQAASASGRPIVFLPRASSELDEAADELTFLLHATGFR